MKATGIIRKVDDLGRIVIPMELRRILDIKEGLGLAFFVDGEEIILKKHQPDCVFCGEAKDVINYKGKNVCKHCLKDLKENA